ncbi:hypothetical protein Q5424_01365 [Conexibacter sp. JD483]|uniref:hypothetical protein n=1 Tax=unclassified Conexibacter TaxID=2627773 RepID=UPI0027198143|nr:MULTISPECIES: hypothetical protein [unclassified Conexibacter]MDO8185879.1 hypothetical protein [Conexibacter sp. CPCC 205706]MDO8198622.1 hypothetical protein [Conexibacter sp. CPCC 205762]MDR9367708.1 hypothetical protein [Conexibacter sp. JD483]
MLDPAVRRACKSLVDGYLAVEARVRDLDAQAAALNTEAKALRRSQRSVAESIRTMGGGEMLDAASRRFDQGV